MLEELRGASILVTGATGFLGRRLVPRLCAAGAKVSVQVRRAEAAIWEGVEVLEADLREAGWSDMMRNHWHWDAVAHLAGSVPTAALDFAGQAEAAREHVQLALAMSAALPSHFRGRVVHASSMSVYGAAPELPVREAQPLSPRFQYAFGKVLAEDVWRASPCIDSWWLRLPGLFSAERKSGALYHFTRAALEQRPIVITASEPTLWDVLHVDDAAEAVARALASPARLKGPLNVSYGEVVDLESMARLISRLTTGVEVINQTGVEHPPFQLDIRLARELLDWPPCTLESRIAELAGELGRGVTARNDRESSDGG